MWVVTADTWQSASVMKCHAGKYSLKAKQRRWHQLICGRNFFSLCFAASMIMGISSVWAVAVNPTLSVKFYNSIFSNSPHLSTREILQDIKWFIQRWEITLYRVVCSTVRCKRWVFKMETIFGNCASIHSIILAARHLVFPTTHWDPSTATVSISWVL